MISNIYKNIIKKLNLSKTELENLKVKLTLDNVCLGPFQKNRMMCPNTNALAIKHKVSHFSNNMEIQKFFHQHGVSKTELWMFYIFFDIPAMLSKSYAEKSLLVFRTVVDELIAEK